MDNNIKDFQTNLRIELSEDTYTVLFIHCKHSLVDYNIEGNFMPGYGIIYLQYYIICMCVCVYILSFGHFL